MEKKKQPTARLRIKVILSLLLLVGATSSVKAQLFQYSLYKFTPMNLNPALVAADDDQDASLIFRNQSIGNEGGIRSTQLNMTRPFMSSRGRWGGIGIQITDDRSGEAFFFKRNSVALAFAYNLELVPGQNLTVGLSGEYERKSITSDGWRTGSQWSGSRYDVSLPTGENFENLKESSTNYHTGVYYQMEDKNGKPKVYAGISFLYANQPKEAFAVEKELPSTFLVHGGAKVWDNGDISLTPQVLWSNRAAHNFLNVGATVSYATDRLNLDVLKGEGSLDLGVSYVNQKAVVVGLTLNQPHYNIGFSYDIDVNSESNVSGFKGAPEVVLRVYNTLDKGSKKKKKKTTPKKKKKKPTKKKKTTKKKSTPKKGDTAVKPLALPPVFPELQPIQREINLVEASGIPSVPKIPTTIFIKRNLYFDFNKANLLAETEEKVFLEKLVQHLKANPDVVLRITGHTDDRGTDEFNLRLSFQRAYTVAMYLHEKGIAKERLLVEGNGEFNPILPNTNESSRAINRRVEVQVVPLGNSK